MWGKFPHLESKSWGDRKRGARWSEMRKAGPQLTRAVSCGWCWAWAEGQPAHSALLLTPCEHEERVACCLQVMYSVLAFRSWPGVHFLTPQILTGRHAMCGGTAVTETDKPLPCGVAVLRGRWIKTRSLSSALEWVSAPLRGDGGPGVCPPWTKGLEVRAAG